jgi:hypothetical protein
MPASKNGTAYDCGKSTHALIFGSSLIYKSVQPSPGSELLFLAFINLPLENIFFT